MRVANCKAVCSEIEEADYGANLTAPVMEHLTGCAQCQRFYDERRKLRKLVASLETVSAPADFDLRVRSRLANQSGGARSGFLFGGFTFGFPSAALTTLALVIGGVFAFRVWNSPNPNVAVQTGATQPTRPRVQPQSTDSGQNPNADKQVLTSATRDSSEAIPQDRQPKKRIQSRNTVAWSRTNRRLVTREFSSTAAPVVKKEDAVASLESSPIFPIETSSQPLRLSLDYSGGVSRTISVPALSFGSEKVLSGDGLSLVKNSPKGAW